MSIHFTLLEWLGEIVVIYMIVVEEPDQDRQVVVTIFKSIRIEIFDERSCAFTNQWRFCQYPVDSLLDSL